MVLHVDALASPHHEVRLSGYAHDDRSRLGDELRHTGVMQRRVVRVFVGPDLGDRNLVGMVRGRDEVHQAVRVGLHQLGRAQEVLHQLVSSTWCGDEGTEQPVGHSAILPEKPRSVAGSAEAGETARMTPVTYPAGGEYASRATRPAAPQPRDGGH